MFHLASLANLNGEREMDELTDLEYHYSKGANGYVVVGPAASGYIDILDSVAEIDYKYGRIYHDRRACDAGCYTCSNPQS
jgi:hypothetical protein